MSNDGGKIEVVDLSPDASVGDSIKSFLNEQMRHVKALTAAVRKSGGAKESVEELVAYVRGAALAAADAVKTTWPELRDTGILSAENRERVTRLQAQSQIRLWHVRLPTSFSTGRSRPKRDKMFVTTDQVLAHVVGDYFFQSDWMAMNKKDKALPCLVHVLTYVLPFLLITTSVGALAVIAGTHFVIDHWSLARYPIWLKNKVLGGSKPWKDCRLTGFDPDRPVWLSFWLMVIVDNAAHVVINAYAVKWVAQLLPEISVLLALGIALLLITVTLESVVRTERSHVGRER